MLLSGLILVAVVQITVVRITVAGIGESLLALLGQVLADALPALQGALHEAGDLGADQAGVAPPVDRDDEAFDRVLVGRANPGPGPGSLARPDPHVIFVVLPLSQRTTPCTS